MLKFTVIGRHGPYPAPGGGTSCYLISSGSTRIVVDMGCCALSRLQQVTELWSVDAIIISHLHADHVCDLLPARYYFMFDKRAAARPIKLKVFLPMQSSAELDMLRTCPKFDLRDIALLRDTSIGDISCTSFAMTHSVPSNALRFDCAGRRLTYSGDTTFNDNIASSLSGAHAYLCDFANVGNIKDSPHIPAVLAAKLAKQAGARLFMTHFTGTDTVRAHEIAREAGHSDAVAVEELQTYSV